MSDDQTTAPLKRGRGRPPGVKSKNLTPAKHQLVRVMAAMGQSDEKIAAALGVSVLHLRMQCTYELMTTMDMLNIEVIAKLFETATRGKERDAFRAQEFWVRCNAGWHEFVPRPWQPTAPTPPPVEEQQTTKQPKLGKKEQASRDAQENPTSGGWAGLVN